MIKVVVISKYFFLQACQGIYPTYKILSFNNSDKNNFLKALWVKVKNAGNQPFLFSPQFLSIYSKTKYYRLKVFDLPSVNSSIMEAVKVLAD